MKFEVNKDVFSEAVSFAVKLLPQRTTLPILSGVLITVEEGSIGGFGDHVLHFLTLDGALDDGNLKVRPMVLPDTYFEAGTQQEQYDMAGLNSQHIRGTILRLTERVQVPVLSEQD